MLVKDLAILTMFNKEPAEALQAVKSFGIY